MISYVLFAAATRLSSREACFRDSQLVQIVLLNVDSNVQYVKQSMHTYKLSLRAAKYFSGSLTTISPHRYSLNWHNPYLCSRVKGLFQNFVRGERDLFDLPPIHSNTYQHTPTNTNICQRIPTRTNTFPHTSTHTNTCKCLGETSCIQLYYCDENRLLCERGGIYLYNSEGYLL